MVGTRSKVSKQRDRSKHRVAEDAPGGHDYSPVLSSGENSVDCPPAEQFVTTKQLVEALKQVQEAITQGVCERMKTSKCQSRAI